jgi:hypothetical protein
VIAIDCDNEGGAMTKPVIKLYNPIPQPVRAMQYKESYRKEFLDKIPKSYWEMSPMRTLRIRVGTEWFGIREDEWLIMGEHNEFPLDIMSNTTFRTIYQTQ